MAIETWASTYQPKPNLAGYGNLMSHIAQVPDFDRQPEFYQSAMSGGSDPTTFGRASNQAAFMRRLNNVAALTPDQQSRWWESLTEAQQLEYRALGYEPRAESGGGILGAIGSGFGAVGKAIGAVTPDVIQNGAMAAVTGKYGVLNTLHRVGDAPQQAFRLGYAVADGMDLDDAWNATFHGEGFHSAASIENAKGLLSGDTQLLKLARRMSAGKSPEEIMKEMGLNAFDPNDKERFTELMKQQNSEEFQEALKELDRGKVSMGRFFARNVMRLDHGTAAFNVFSGAVDGSVAVFLDPTLYAGKLIKAQRAAKFALNTGSDSLRMTGKAADDLSMLPDRIDEIMDITSDAGRRRVHWWSSETVAEATNKGLSDWGMKIKDGNFRQLIKENREAAPLFDALSSKRVVRTRKVTEEAADGTKKTVLKESNWEPLQLHLQKVYDDAIEGGEEAAEAAVGRVLGEEMRDEVIWEAIARGRGPGARRSQLELPYLTKAGIKRRQTQQAFTQVRDWVAEGDPKWLAKVSKKIENNVPLTPKEKAAFFWDDATDAADLALLPHVPLPSNITNEDILRLGINVDEPLKKSQLKELIDDPRFKEHYDAYTGRGIGYQRETFEGNKLQNVAEFISHVPGAKSFAKFTRTAGARVPYDEISQRVGKSIRLYGPDAPRQIADFVELGSMWGMSANQRHAWANAIIASPQAGRRAMVTAYMDTIFTNLNVRATPEGSKFLDDFIKRMKQSYAATSGVDDMTRAGQKTVSALDPSRELSEFIAVPDVRALLSITKRQSFMKTMGAGMNTRAHTAIMNKYIKPGLVLRAAFLPRAAGDEWLSYILRKSGMLSRSNLAKWSVADIQMDELVRFDDLGVEGGNVIERSVRLTGEGLPPFLKAGYRTLNRVRDRRVFRAGGSGPLHSLSKDEAYSRWSKRKQARLMHNSGRNTGDPEYVYRQSLITNPFDEATLRAAGVEPGSYRENLGLFDYEIGKNAALGNVKDIYSYSVLRDTPWGNDLLDQFAENLVIKMTFGMQNKLRKGIGVTKGMGKVLSKTPVLRHFGTQVGDTYKFMAVHPETQLATRRFFRNELHKAVYMQAVVNSKGIWQPFDNPHAFNVEDGSEAGNAQQYIALGSDMGNYGDEHWMFPQMLYNRQREVAESRFMRDALDHSFNYMDATTQAQLETFLTALDQQYIHENLDETMEVLRRILNTDGSGDLKAYMADVAIFPGRMAGTVDEAQEEIADMIDQLAYNLEISKANSEDIAMITAFTKEWTTWAFNARHADPHDRQISDFMHWMTGNMMREDAYKLSSNWDEVQQGMDDILFRQFMDTENWEEIRKMERFQTLGDGSPLAQPLPDGVNQFYTGQVARRHLEPLFHERSRRSIIAEGRESLSPRGAAMLEDLLSDKNAPMWGLYGQEILEPVTKVGDQLFPLPIASTDIESVREITSFLNKSDTAELAYLRDARPGGYDSIPRPPGETNPWNFKQRQEMLTKIEGAADEAAEATAKAAREEYTRWQQHAAAGFNRLSGERGVSGLGHGHTYSPDLHSLKNHVSLSSDTPITQMGAKTFEDAGSRVTYPVFVEGATHEAAARDFSRRNINYIQENFGFSAETMDGLANDALAPFLARRWDDGVGDFVDLAEVSTTQKSADRVTRSTKGPLMEAVPDKGLWARGVETGFEQIGYGIDAIIRQPLYLGHYLEADAMARQFAQHAIDDPEVSARVANMFSKEWYTDVGLDSGELRIDWHKLNEREIRKMARPLESQRAGEILDAMNDDGFGIGLDAMFVTDEFDDIVGLTQRFSDATEFRRLLDLLPEEEAAILRKAVSGAMRDGKLNPTEAFMTFERMGFHQMDYKQFRASLSNSKRRALVPEEFMFIGEDEFRALRKHVIDGHEGEKLVASIQGEYAMRMSAPFIDNHIYRSQFADWGANVFPFWFAEEQFIRRWGRTFRHSPEALRKAQLLIQGLGTAGIVRKDPVNNDYIYVMPGSALVPALLDKFNPMASGERIPIAMPLTGKLKYMTPGLDASGIPQFAPIPSWTVSSLKRLLPESVENPFDETLNRMTGDRGRDRDPIEYLVPSHMLKIYNAAFQDSDANRIISSSMVQAMQFMEANGMTPASNATSDEIEIYMERVQQWARTLAMTNAMYSFAMPSSASQGQYFANLEGAGPVGWLKAAVGWDLEEVPRPKFTENLGTMEYSEAVALFMEQNPDGTPWTVFEKKNVTGAPTSMSAAAGRYMDSNQDFFTAYDTAGAWFLPGPQQFGTDFEYETYARQLAFGWRVERGPDEFYREMKARAASAQYYENRRKRDELLEAAAEDPDRRREIRTDWKSWRDDYMLINPLFREDLESPETRHRIARTITEVGQALLDPNLPIDHHTSTIRRLHRGWENFQNELAKVGQGNTNAQNEARDRIKEAYAAWGIEVTESNYQLRVMWDSVYVPAAGLR